MRTNGVAATRGLASGALRSSILLAVLGASALAGCAGGAGQQRLAGAPDAPTTAQLQAELMAEFARLGLEADKIAAAAPDGPRSAVCDLSARRAGSGTDYSAELSWTEQACGDYDENGVVGLSDLTPLGIHWLKTVAYAAGIPAGDPADDGGVGAGKPPAAGSGAQNWRLARIDGNHDGVLNIGDITPLAVHWNKRLDGYRVYQRLAGMQDWTLLGVLAPRPPVDPTRPVRYSYTTQVGAPGHYEFLVTAYDQQNDDAGAESNLAALEMLAPDYWQMFGHDAQRTFRSGRSGPETPQLKWKFELGAGVNGTSGFSCSAAAIQGLAFNLDNKLFYLDDTGQTKRIDTARQYASYPQLYSDGASLVYYREAQTQALHLAALSATGQLEWDRLLDAEASMAAVLDANENAYIVSSDSPPAPSSTKLHVFSRAGELTREIYLPGSLCSSIIFNANNEIYCIVATDISPDSSADICLISIDQTGQELWRTFLYHRAGAGSVYLDGPVVRRDGTILVSVYDKVIAVSASGEQLWSQDMYAPETDVYAQVRLVTDNANNAYALAIYHEPYDYLKKFDAAGNLVWTLPFEYHMGQRALDIIPEQQLLLCSVTDSNDDTSLNLISLGGTVLKTVVDPHRIQAIYHDAGHFYLATAVSLLALTPGLEREWSFNERGYVRTSPACAPDGSVYLVGGDEHIYKVDSDGNKLWSKTKYFNRGEVLASSPAVDDAGAVYVGDNAYYDFYAISPDGSDKWSYRTSFSIHSSPVISSNGTIYFHGDRGSIYSLSSTGELNWSHFNEYVSFPSPALSYDGRIYTFKSTALLAFAPDGVANWDIDVSGGNIMGHVSVAGNGTVYYTTRGTLWAVSALGATLWSFSTEAIDAAAPVIMEGPALAGDGGIVLALENSRVIKLNQDGTLAWQFQAPAIINSTPALDGNDTIYFGCENGLFLALNADGTLKWEYQAGGAVFASPAIGNDGSILFGADDGCFYALGP